MDKKRFITHYTLEPLWKSDLHWTQLSTKSETLSYLFDLYTVCLYTCIQKYWKECQLIKLACNNFFILWSRQIPCLIITTMFTKTLTLTFKHFCGVGQRWRFASQVHQARLWPWLRSANLRLPLVEDKTDTSPAARLCTQLQNLANRKMMNINPCLKLGSREISPPQAFYRGSNCLIGLKCNFISSTSTTCHQVSWPISGLGNRMLRVKTPAFYSSRPILKWVNFRRFCSRRVLWISGIRGHYSN